MLVGRKQGYRVRKDETWQLYPILFFCIILYGTVESFLTSKDVGQVWDELL